jgi:hypothetical protein
MTKARVFTKEELKAMEVLPLDNALAAVEAGDKEKAKQYIRAMHKDAQAIVDSFLTWVVDIMDYVYVNYGDEVLEKALRTRFERSESKRAERYDKMDIRNRVQTHAGMLRALLQPLEITEDDEKVCISMKQCGSGQRLVDMGVYNPPRSVARMKPHRLTWNQANFPLYCAHGALQEIVSIEKIGYPTYVHLFSGDVGSKSCRFCFYKNPKDIPEEVYKRVGMKKPK